MQAVVATNILNSIAAKEDNYRASIRENHFLSKVLHNASQRFARRIGRYANYKHGCWDYRNNSDIYGYFVFGHGRG
jgi:hypothetical protein